MKRCLYLGLAACLHAASTLAQINLYPTDLVPSPTNLTSGCIAAINATINCNASMVPQALADYYGSIGNKAAQDNICSSNCGSGLTSWRSNVVSQCGSGAQLSVGYPVTYVGDLVRAYYNLTCLKDTSTGQYCSDYISNVASSITTDTSLTSLNKTVLCSNCMTSLLRNQQGTAFSYYNTSSAQTFAQIQSLCGVSYPTARQPPAASAIPSNFANSSYSAPCLSGNSYKVVSGDNCEKIAEAKNVSTGTLISLNNLLPDCSNLQLGQNVCLPQSCTTYNVASGDTCQKIATANSLTLTQLFAWNPALNQQCSNLLSGQNICVGIPGNTAWNGTTIAGATATQTAVYATTTVAPPGATGYRTTTQCGKFYQVQSGDYCQIVALNNSIAVNLFEAINPSIDSGCDNLVPHLYYCVLPTAEWNNTVSSNTTSTTTAAPGPTASGTTKSCYQWYTVESNDNCYIIEQSNNITFTQFQGWNPSIDTNCDNLILGDSYCVHGN